MIYGEKEVKCPNCNAIVPGSWKTCRCGYNLMSSQPVATPLYKKNVESAKLTEKRRKFIEKTSRPAPADSAATKRVSEDATQILDTSDLMAKQQAEMQKAKQSIDTRADSDATQIIDSESLVAKQKAEMLKASEAIRKRYKGGDSTQILDVTETPIQMTNPNLQTPAAQVRSSINTEGIAPGDAGSTGNVSSGVGSYRRINFFGNGTTLLGIYIVNILLMIPTLLIYFFWGKIRAARYLYSQADLDGDRFEFHGTGLELFLGFIKAILAIGVVIGSAFAIMYLVPGVIAKILGGIFIYIVIVLLIPLAILFTVKYRYSRTSWRGVRFSFRGNTKEFLKLYVKGFFLTSLTAGFYYYSFHYRTREYLINNIYFGDTKFEFDGNINDFYSRYTKLWLVAILISGAHQLLTVFMPTIGTDILDIGYFVLFIIWGIFFLKFLAQRHNHYWNHTKFVSARFNLNIEEKDYVKLQIVNYILLIFTLGIAYPYVQIRNIKFLLDRLSLQGDLDLIAIQQDARTPTALGEEVASFLDIDLVGMDLGI